MKINFKSLISLILVVGAILLIVSLFNNNSREEDKVVYSDVIELLDNDLVTSFEYEDGTISLKHVVPERDENGSIKLDTNNKPIIKLNDDGKEMTAEKSYKLSYGIQLEEILSIAREKSQTDGTRLKNYDIVPPQETPWYLQYLPYIITALIVIVLIVIVMRSANAGGGRMNSFSKSKAKVAANEKNQVKFSDVAGADEEKAELEEVVEFLKDPSKFVKLGARIPRGVLLVGPPGTGKTLLAKAVAGEAGVPFFSISGSDFVEMYVGVGASRVRDLFDNARKTPASIIFIDEIDAVGRHRGAGLGGGHDEREQTLNQLLVEMDGFGTSSGVIVMAATNRPDILDPALLRPGRFDRQVTVNYPDMKGREEILKVHCRNKPLEEGVDLHKIAQTTIGYTGAELANLMNEAALLAAKKNKALIGMEEIEESYMKLLLGPQKKTKMRTEKDNKLCAYHEAGHAVAAFYCEHADPVKHITIIPAGSAGGVTVSVPTEDRMGMSKNEMLDMIVRALGGRVAEQIVLDDISTGASSDIRQATSIAKQMVTRYGMSDKLGTVLYGSEHSADEVFLGRDFSSGKDYSEQTAATIDEEIRRIIGDSYSRCEAILSEHIDKLHFVAQFLLKNESMDDEQFRAAMEMNNPTMESIEEIATQRKQRSEEENKNAQKKNALDEEEERIRREKLSEKMAKGEPLTDEVLREIFSKHTAGENDDSDDEDN
ncbi:MAG: ATP-dependent zinc metalloprotease FtsH [Clostridia bacterium]|nr:ATP-dependent zinc metalloprotease FtsH [Clostridia bacterium]